MALVTLFEESSRRYSVEEDRKGRLWLSIPLRDPKITELHLLLNPDEIRDFRAAPKSLDVKVRFLMHNPRRHFDPTEEADYRRQ